MPESMPERIPNRVFVSYSRQDQEWLQKMEAHLAPLQHQGLIDPWIDTGKIDYGDRYNDEIGAAIDSASAAVLLVSQHFQNSSFIREKELPRLLRHADAGELKLYWVLVSDCVLADELGATYHCANDSQDALDGMNPAQVNKVLANLGRNLRDQVQDRLQRIEAARQAALQAERARQEWEVAERREAVIREAISRAGKDSPYANSLGMKFVPVPGTKVLMGIWETRVQDYAAYAAEQPKGFLGIGGINASWKDVEFKGHKQGPDHPVVNVSWEDAQGFCKWLSQKEGKTYRLPTDHEWSLAVGIGDREDPNASPASKDGKIEGVYPWGSQCPPPDGVANVNGSGTVPVGSYAPNPAGFCDLGGNVWEWCEDFYDGKSGSRVLRGASWNDYGPFDLLSSDRLNFTPSFRFSGIGFRVVLVGSGER